LKEVTKNWNIAKQGHFVTRLPHFVLKQTANRQCIAAADQNVGLQGAGINDRAAHRCTGKYEGGTPTLLLISGFTFMVTKLSLLMLGVTMRVLPNFLSWNPPKTAVAVCSLKFSWGTGWARLISIFACKLSAVTTRGLARNSASLSSFRKRKVADICGTLRMANW